MRRRNRSAYIFLLGLCAPLCLARTSRAVPQLGDDNARINGTVVDEASHQPISSARVELVGPSGLAAPTKYTSLNGKFYFGAPDGDYHLVIRKMGYRDGKASVSVYGASQSRVDVELVRETSDSKSSAAPFEVISAHELTISEKAREWYREGKTLTGKKDYNGAVAQFQKAIKESPSYYEAYAGMGIAQYLLGQAPAARASMQKSVDLSEGKYSEGLLDFASVLNGLHDFASAETFARQGIALEGTSWRGHLELARALLGLNRLTEAELSAREAQKLNGQDAQVYVVLVNIHAGMRHYNAVLRDIDAYLALEPSGPMSDQMRTTRAQAAKALADAGARSSHKQE